jgi:hypothetical protein
MLLIMSLLDTIEKKIIYKFLGILFNVLCGLWYL